MKLPKTAGGIIGLIGKIIGSVAIAAPAISAVQMSMTDPAGIPNRIIYNYTGFNTNDGSFSPQQAATGIGTVIAGTGLIYLFKFISKLVR